jgi:hypothetical protein
MNGLNRDQRADQKCLDLWTLSIHRLQTKWLSISNTPHLQYWILHTIFCYLFIL